MARQLWAYVWALRAGVVLTAVALYVRAHPEQRARDRDWMERHPWRYGFMVAFVVIPGGAVMRALFFNERWPSAPAWIGLAGITAVMTAAMGALIRYQASKRNARNGRPRSL